MSLGRSDVGERSRVRSRAVGVAQPCRRPRRRTQLPCLAEPSRHATLPRRGGQSRKQEGSVLAASSSAELVALARRRRHVWTSPHAVLLSYNAGMHAKSSKYKLEPGFDRPGFARSSFAAFTRVFWSFEHSQERCPSDGSRLRGSTWSSKRLQCSRARPLSARTSAYAIAATRSHSAPRNRHHQCVARRPTSEQQSRESKGCSTAPQRWRRHAHF